MLYYLGIFSLFAWSKSTNKTVPNLAVSVVVCAKNESKNLEALIPLLLNQNYKNFELVLINDASTDDTRDVIKNFASKNTCIKIVDVKENEQFWGNKKYALTLGIKAATHEHLLFTDADCRPNSTNWITSMVQNFSSKKQIVLGYGAYKKDKTFLNKLIRYETLLTALQYFSYAKIGTPYMGVGRNLAYTKSVFFKVNGFINHMRIRSGDDDLFINEAANKDNTAICFEEDTITTSIPKTSFKEWILQKRRHISTAKHYKKSHQFLLGLFYVSQILFWILAITLSVLAIKPLIVLPLIGARFLIFYLILFFSAKKLQEKDLILFAFFFEISLILIQLRIFIGNLFSKPTHW
ncbi:MAG: glycosyltransferase [Flavobacteriaceae bacterium]|nr:glycosyltransferase [Flavobacteriaceae bacterium]